MNPLVTVVVLLWRGERHIHRCIEHVFAQSYTKLDVIVIDNGSEDSSTLESVKAKYGNRCRCIRNSRNAGYAAGMNQGIDAAKGEFVIPLNQDVCLHRDFVSECVRRISCDAKIGAIGGRVYSWTGDALTMKLRRGEGGASFLRKRFQVYADERLEREALVFGPAGSFPLLRMRMLRDVRESTGYVFDPGFGTGWEDTDLWFRMQLRGWSCLFLPTAYGWHVGSGSVDGKATFFSKPLGYRTRILRNRLYTISKNLPWRVFLWLAPYLIATEVAMVPYFLVRSPTSAVAFVLAWLQFIANAGAVLQKRRLVQSSTVVPASYVRSLFVKY